MNAIEEVALAAVPGGSGLKLAIKLAPFVILALLVGIIGVQRLSLRAAKAERDNAVEQAKALGDLAVTNANTIKNLSARQVDNDAIAAAITKRLDSNRARTEGQRQAIRNASNDPTVRDWANQPVPSGVRNVLEAGSASTGSAPGGRAKR
jgi:hypothetical protein